MLIIFGISEDVIPSNAGNILELMQLHFNLNQKIQNLRRYFTLYLIFTWYAVFMFWHELGFLLLEIN